VKRASQIRFQLKRDDCGDDLGRHYRAWTGRQNIARDVACDWPRGDLVAQALLADVLQ